MEESSETTENIEEDPIPDDSSDGERKYLEDKADIVRGFLQEREILERANEEEIEELRFSFESEKENMVQAFEYEREEMRRTFSKDKEKIRFAFQEEKHVMKMAFEDEKLNIVSLLEKEIDEMRKGFDKERKDMQDSFAKSLRDRDHHFRLEKAEIEGKVRKEIERVQEVEGEIKTALLKGLGDLENVYFDETAILEEWCNNEQPEADMHLKGNTEAGLRIDRKHLFQNMGEEKNKMFMYHSTRQSELEHEFSGEIVELQERFKEQKKDLMIIFKNEKQEIEDKYRREKEDIRYRIETEFRRVLKQERLKYDSTFQAYEHDITMLRYQKEQLERCYSLEMEKLQFKFERDRLEMEKKLQKEKRDFKRLFKEHYARKACSERSRLEWLLQQFNLNDSQLLQGNSRSSSYSEIFRGSNSSFTSGSSEL
jgi:hypothetical protein